MLNHGKSPAILNLKQSASTLISFYFYVKFNTSEVKCRFLLLLYGGLLLYVDKLCVSLTSTKISHMSIGKSYACHYYKRRTLTANLFL